MAESTPGKQELGNGEEEVVRPSPPPRRDAVVSLSAIKTTGTIRALGVEREEETLLDTGGEISLIDPALAMLLRLPTAEVALPKNASWGGGQKPHCYGAHLLEWDAVDSKGARRRSTHVVYVIEHIGPALLLGMPALQK